MNYLTLNELKKQCVIDLDFHDDDEYLESLGDAAEELVQRHINTLLSDVAAKHDGNLPAPLKHAIKMIVEYFYNNRGSDSTTIPEAYFYMCNMYRKFHAAI
jgi:uncharacterized phage protein (predicted DNA packaging)